MATTYFSISADHTAIYQIRAGIARTAFSVDGILLKLRSFEHTDLNRAPFNEPSHISHHIQHGIDLFDRENQEFTWRDAPDRLPRALTEYPDRFRPLFLPDNAARKT